jgi:phosphoserine phosphatase
MSFEEALNARLNIIRPSHQMIESCLEAHPPRLTSVPSLFSTSFLIFSLTLSLSHRPYISELIDTLHNRGIPVYLVSGGFHQMIRPIADLVGVPLHRIYANNILFDGHLGKGDYLCFDNSQYTCRDGGKASVVKHLKAELGVGTVVMVGDGVTDMEAQPPADAFIGYGGIVSREPVQRGADWFVTDFRELIKALAEEAPSTSPSLSPANLGS